MNEKRIRAIKHSEKIDYVKVNAESREILNISATLAKCWKFAYQGIINEAYLSSLQDDHWVAFLEKKITENSVECIITKKEEQIVGLVIFGESITEEYPDDGEIHSLYLLPEFIGQGIGPLLFDMAERGLKEKEYKHHLVCVFSKNKAAIQFYESHGFKTVSTGNEIIMGEQKLSYNIMRKARKCDDE